LGRVREGVPLPRKRGKDFEKIEVFLDEIEKGQNPRKRNQLLYEKANKEQKKSKCRAASNA